ncbi:hypothetical protein NVP1259O_17 [Vibrio phage 1.259.O._10N.286.48.F4]|nr:hypothetical protein NVP1259O_17 [Vibrio phage 1.259.O._10N.286.48.F4]
MINWYRLGRRSDYISSRIPQYTLSEYINGQPVRVDLSEVITSQGAAVTGVNVVYDGYSIPTRKRYRGYVAVVDDKYGAYESTDGFIYFGVKV